jgi:hypothetical protein
MVREDRRNAEGEEDDREKGADDHRIGLPLPAAEQRRKRVHGLPEHLHGPDAQKRVMPLSSRGTVAAS